MPVYPVFAFILVLLSSAVFPSTAFANSGESPSLTVIVSVPPDDLSLSIRFADGSETGAVQLEKEQKAWESYYRFFYGMTPSRPSFEGATLIVRSRENNFECILPESSLSQHNGLLTLDVENQSIREGQSPARLLFLIFMRVILTLIIEGLVFFVFGYRSKRSWIVFVVVNLITQSALNALLTGPNLGGYWVFGFAFYEFFIFITEMAAFALLLKEHRKSLAVGCAFTANFASLVLGGILISRLPI
jgi:hypothetical protein